MPRGVFHGQYPMRSMDVGVSVGCHGADVGGAVGRHGCHVGADVDVGYHGAVAADAVGDDVGVSVGYHGAGVTVGAVVVGVSVGYHGAGVLGTPVGCHDGAITHIHMQHTCD